MIKLKNRKKNLLSSNRGSTLITVIVVVGFMSILVTVLLYLVGENYKTKIYDLKTKESFYEAEEIVELFKASLIREVAECSKPAYDSVIVNYSQSKSKEVRETQYYTFFKTEFVNGIESRAGITTGFDGKKNVSVSGIITGFLPGSESITGTDYYKITINGNSLKYKLSVSDPAKFFVPPVKEYDDTSKMVSSYMINDVEITVVDESTGYVSKIHTSFQITPPQLNWGDVAINTDSKLDYTECVKFYNYSKE